jgi:hypothetical protein
MRHENSKNCYRLYDTDFLQEFAETVGTLLNFELKNIKIFYKPSFFSY